ncbi:MAG: glucose sorbosone dehydrogenase [Halioglobus sp.]|nr:glucose sorbosone dehydrogenase [Halioglobus sp.]
MRGPARRAHSRRGRNASGARGLPPRLLCCALLLSCWPGEDSRAADRLAASYLQHCAACHGADLKGGGRAGTALLGVELAHGASMDDIDGSIARLPAHRGAPGEPALLDAQARHGIAFYVAERRAERLSAKFKLGAPVVVPAGVIASERHAFRVEEVTAGLDPRPFSLQPLPDGRILVSEKTRGLRVVGPGGEVSAYIEGIPGAHADAQKSGWGHGWLLDVALHPEYADNGWIYLHHTKRCGDCTDAPKSFNRVVRGRIRAGRWVDEQEIWYPGDTYFSAMPDIGAGGRLAFDRDGYLFFSVGIKGRGEYDGADDLGKPWGKVHRLHADGRVPRDNPFVSSAGALASIWTYGHRNPQGLEYAPHSATLWSTEMGPRGGDELNRLLPGRDYGWPRHSLGLNYDGTPLRPGVPAGGAAPRQYEQPVIDFTPAPALSSFIVYAGSRFPRWRGDLLVGSLKGASLYRLELDAHGRHVHTEVLLQSLARIRDIESGPDGAIYLLLEHPGGGRILRLVPAGD